MLRQRALVPFLLTFLALAPLLAVTHPFYPNHRQQHSSSGPQRIPLQDPPPPRRNDPSQQTLFKSLQKQRDQQQHSFEWPQEQERDQGNVDPLSDTQRALGGQTRPDEVLTLRHILHHGGSRYPRLFRRLDPSRADLLLNEVLTGQSMSHRIKVKTTTTVKPKGEAFKSFRSRGFRAMGIAQDQSFGPESYERHLVDAPDMMDQETLVQLGMMNYNSYTEVASPGWYDLEDNWGVVSLFPNGLGGRALFRSRGMMPLWHVDKVMQVGKFRLYSPSTPTFTDNRIRLLDGKKMESGAMYLHPRTIRLSSLPLKEPPQRFLAEEVTLHLVIR